MAVSLKDIREAFEFVCAGGGGEHQAFLCKQSGKKSPWSDCQVHIHPPLSR